MNRLVLGAVAALVLAGVGLFWWQGRAETERGAPPPYVGPTAGAGSDTLPHADIAGLRGPTPPEATRLSREQRRFLRYDRDNDGRITRNEMMATRTAAFRKLDTDGNNLLTFEEWAVATANRFKAADRDGNLELSPEEFAATKTEQPKRPTCKC